MTPPSGLPQKFYDGWLQNPAFKDWLEKSHNTRRDDELAYCKICNCTITALKNEINRHRLSAKHKRKENLIDSNKNMKKAVQKCHTTDDIKRAEMKLAALIAEKDLPFQVMDTLVPLCKNIFPDSKIAARLSSKKDKNNNNNKKKQLETTF